MSIQKGIGRQVQFGIAKEVTRGTAPSVPAYYLAWADGLLDEKYENVTDVESYGVIEDSANQTRTKNYAEGVIKVPVTDVSFGLFLFSLLGTDTPTAEGSPNAVVYDHAFTVAQNVQHQSIACYVHDPLAAQDYAHANCVVTKMDIEFALKQFISASVTIKGLKGTQISTLTPSQAVENRFVPQHVTFKVASSYSGLAAASATAIKSLKLTIDQNTDDDDVLGQAYPRDFLNKEFKIEGTLEAIFNGESDYKTAALANTYKALRIDIKNTDVTLAGVGVTANPHLVIDLAKVFFTEFGLPRKLKDLVYQTVKFKASYSITDALMVKATLSNEVSAY